MKWFNPFDVFKKGLCWNTNYLTFHLGHYCLDSLFINITVLNLKQSVFLLSFIYVYFKLLIIIWFERKDRGRVPSSCNKWCTSNWHVSLVNPFLVSKDGKLDSTLLTNHHFTNKLEIQILNVLFIHIFLSALSVLIKKMLMNLHNALKKNQSALFWSQI